jgi:hypothetical protein
VVATVVALGAGVASLGLDDDRVHDPFLKLR